MLFSFPLRAASLCWLIFVVVGLPKCFCNDLTSEILSVVEEYVAKKRFNDVLG